MYVIVPPFSREANIALLKFTQDVEEVTEDGAPSGRKDFLVWNSPLKDPMDPALGRINSMTEATRLMRFLMARGVRVILFCKVETSRLSRGRAIH